MKKYLIFLNSCIVYIIAFLLLFLPFFWFQSGEIDVGGDGAKMFIYDPVNFIKNTGLYIISPNGSGVSIPHAYYLPFASLVAFLKMIFQSEHIISVFHNGVKLSIGFIAMYLIARELYPILIGKKQEFSNELRNKEKYGAIITGLFYVFIPTMLRNNSYVNPLSIHDLVFLNPLMFFLLLRFFLTQKIVYLWFLILISFIFSHNFSLFAAPGLFSFFPLAICFLFIVVLLICRKKLPIKKMLLGIFFLVGVHAFHLVPELANVFESGSNLNTQAFNREAYQEQLEYFRAVLSFGNKLPLNILIPSENGGFRMFFAIVSPLIIFLGFLQNKKRSTLFLTTALFFLLTLFLLSAKILYVGLKLYESLFLYIPGFVMFRSFEFHFLGVFSFFYSLLFGQALLLFILHFKKKQWIVTVSLILIYLIGGSWQFINGTLFNPIHIHTKNIGKHIVMDKRYEDTLSFMRKQTIDGRVLVFPFSDFNYQVVHGTGRGAYMGSSTVGQLTGIKDIAGYWHTVPFSDAFVTSIQKRDYKTLRKILGFLNVRYILHNQDPRVYDDYFLGRPYDYVKQVLPSSQKEYKEFIKPLVKDTIFESGPYKVYLTDEKAYIPHIYIPKKIIPYVYNPKYDVYYHAASSFLFDKKTPEEDEVRVAYIEQDDCGNKLPVYALCKEDKIFDTTPSIYFKRINPTKYIVTVKNLTKPVLLVFSEAFNRNWKLFISKDVITRESDSKVYFDGDIEEGKLENIFFNNNTFETLSFKTIPDSQHIKVNGYANAWLINPQDIDNKNITSFIIEMTGQQLFYFSSFVSTFMFCVFIIWGFILFARKAIRK